MGKGAKVEKRDPNAEAKATLKSELEMMPEVLSARKQYDPQFTQLNLDSLRQALAGQAGIAGQIAPQIGQLDAQAQQAGVAADPILALLQGQAVSELGQGGNISNEERIAANEQVRSGYAGRGMAYSNRSLLDQILNRGEISQNRLNQRRAFAQIVYGQTGNAGGAARSLISSLVNPQTAGSSVGQTQVDPYNPYYQEAYQYNTEAQNPANQAKANRKAALWSSVIGGGTSLLRGK
jgi:hypothetical protein